MNNLNSVLIEGNLVRDPVAGYTPKGTSVTNFSIGSNRQYKSGDQTVKEASFFSIETWGRLADTCAEYLEKGRKVRIVGRLKQDRWTDTEGNPHNRVKVVAEHVEFLERPRKSEETKEYDEEIEESYNETMEALAEV